MGSSDPYATGPGNYGAYPNQYPNYQNPYNQYPSNQNPYNANQNQNNQNVSNQNNIKQLSELDPNFLRGCDNVVKEKYSNGDFEGQIKNGKYNGKGIRRWTTGEVYQGEYKNGLMHGK